MTYLKAHQDKQRVILILNYMDEETFQKINNFIETGILINE